MSRRDVATDSGTYRSRPLRLRERLVWPPNRLPRWVPVAFVAWLDDSTDRRIRQDPGIGAWLARALDRVVELALATVAAGALVVVGQVVILLVRWLA